MRSSRVSNAKNRRNFGTYGHTLRCFTLNSQAEFRGRIHRCDCNPFDHASKPKHHTRQLGR